MFYTIYEIKNKINDKIYVGMHQTKDLFDGYMGSGKIIQRAVNKYGEDNFEKNYIHIFDNIVEMREAEISIVDASFVAREDTYNLMLGGKGGWDHFNSNSELQREKSIKSNERQKVLYEDEEWKSQRAKRISISQKLTYQNGRQSLFDGQEFKGKTHSDETKEKIGKANSKHQLGSGNSQFGTCWIYNLEERLSKKIKREELPEYEDLGWLKGRKIKF